MAGGPEIANVDSADRKTVMLSNLFRIDGGRLYGTGYFTGPHKIAFVLSIFLLMTSLVLLSRLNMTVNVSISLITIAIIPAVLSVFCFRASYVRTMPFEIRLDRDSHEIMITRPDRPELVFTSRDISFAIQPRDWFANNLGPYWLTVQLPDSRRFFLTDTSTRKDAELLCEHLEQWLSTSP